MRCPKCEHEKQKVVDTRPVGEETYRKRICLNCGQVFETYEKFHANANYNPKGKRGLKTLSEIGELC